MAQGDILSSLVFDVLLSDLTETIECKYDIVYTLLHAHDAVVYTRSRTYLKRALETRDRYSTGLASGRVIDNN